MQMNEEKLNEWRVLLEERKERKLTVNAFCEEKKITPSQFYYYQQLANKKEKTQAAVKPKKDHLLNIKPIQIVKAENKENVVIRFVLPNSLQCILPRDMSPHEIKAILELAITC